MSYIPVDNSGQIDLTRHALIEASAGTGKTYTIENLVVRLLKERDDIALENILLLTFTEKATSELKIRIREKLEQEITDCENEPVVHEKIKDTLDAFDASSIFTIHGFCHTVLKDFAFENHGLFQYEVIDDTNLFHTRLNEQMRRIWPETYQSYLTEMLAVSGFGTRKGRLLSLIVDIAKRFFRPNVGDEFLPNAKGQSFLQIRAEIKMLLIRLKSLIGHPPVFSDGFNQLNIHAGTKRSLMEKIVVPLESYLAQVDKKDFDAAELSDLIDRIRQTRSSDRRGIECLVPEKWLKAGDNSSVCPNLESIVEKMGALTEAVNRLRYFLVQRAVQQLQQDVAQIKHQNAWISYDDMLGHVESALFGKHSSVLLNRLRKKYKVAFVDEFQDTDPVQWRIFRKIFLDAKENRSENLLFLIGDPKQAIYSFRGADVYTYLSARKEMQNLSCAGKANLYALTTNWRSQPDLVCTFNRLFCQKQWFPQQGRVDKFEISHPVAESPPEADLPVRLVVDDSQRRPLNVIDLSNSRSPKIAKSDLARFIADEIQYLILRGEMVLRFKTGDCRPLDFGDICILVRSRSDVSFLEPELTTREIPYAFYKKPGLFLSDEAVYLSLMFRAILHPDNMSEVKKALLTPFFGWDASSLAGYEKLPGFHSVKRLLYQWSDYARSGNRSLLFQSLMEDSGLFFREAESYDWDRKYTNYRQILEHLETEAYQRNLDFRGLSALLDRYRRQSGEMDHDADIHQIETEDRKVQIMTMHVSKGLQFPIVFIAGGLTQRAVEDDYHIYHTEDANNPASGIRKIVDLSKQYSGEMHDKEKADEDKRLFYVAVTRAQFKLYAPFYPFDGKQRWIGPVCSLLSPAISSVFPKKTDNPGIGWLSQNAHADQDFKGIKSEEPSAAIDRIPDECFLHLPVQYGFQHRKVTLESFSSIHGKAFHEPRRSDQAIGFHHATEKAKEHDETVTVFDSKDLSTIHDDDDLPGGTDVGSMFHDIIEHIDFKAVVENPDRLLNIPRTGDVVLKYMELYHIDERFRSQIGRIISNTLTKPVRMPGMNSSSAI